MYIKFVRCFIKKCYGADKEGDSLNTDRGKQENK